MSNLGGLSPGKLVATANGKVTAHALATLQERGKLFITTGEVRNWVISSPLYSSGLFCTCFRGDPSGWVV